MRMRTKAFVRRLASWIGTAWLLLACNAVLSSPLEITVGIVPQQSATELARVWIPLLQEAATRSGVRLLFQTAPNIPIFEERLRRGEYDLAYMNPYHYTVFSRVPGYKAFAKEKDRRLVGIIVVAKTNAISDMRQLAGKTVAFPAPGSFAASMLPRSEFSRLGIAIQTQYVSSHDSVYRGVAQGLFAAGGGIKRTLEAMDPEVASRLRMLSTTPSYVPHAFAAHPRVDAETLRKVFAAFRSLDQDEGGRRVLAQLSFKGIEAAADRDWDEIRHLKISQAMGRAP
jgi:phosphonate transport system substrate-binding protein